MSEEFFRVVRHPLMTEKAVTELETKGKLTFIVRADANKKLIKEAIEKYFGVKVKKVNVMMTPKGEKKAIVTTRDPEDARRIAISLGIL